MSQLLEIDVDATKALEMMDRLGDVVDRIALEVGMETARAIDDEATARVRRREGQTAENIVHVDHLPEYLGGGPSFNKNAVFVYVQAIRRPDNLALWLEFGTKYSAPHPFLLSAVEIEREGHLRRLQEGLQRACDEVSG